MEFILSKVFLLIFLIIPSYQFEPAFPMLSPTYSTLFDEFFHGNNILYDVNPIVQNSPTKISSRGPDVSRAKKYINLVGAGYCDHRTISDWDCHFCIESAKLGYSYLDSFYNVETNTFAVFVLNRKEKEIGLIFRGTFNLANILLDANLVHCHVDLAYQGLPFPPMFLLTKTKVKVHQGFLKATKSLYPEILVKLEQLIRKYPKYRLVVTGHSLGGAIGSITLYMMINRIGTSAHFPKPASYSLFVYGMPRVGNRYFADFFNKQNDMDVTRVVHRGEIVPHLPPAWLLYIHFGNELWINDDDTDNKEKKDDSKFDNNNCSRSLYEDPFCSNSLGPWYNMEDHLNYWNSRIVACFEKNPLPFFEQFVFSTDLCN